MPRARIARSPEPVPNGHVLRNISQRNGLCLNGGASVEFENGKAPNEPNEVARRCHNRPRVNGRQVGDDTQIRGEVTGRERGGGTGPRGRSPRGGRRGRTRSRGGGERGQTG